MNKFWTILLKILIVASFIGIVAFTGIAILNNQNISYEAYSYIVATHKKTEFTTLKTNIANNVKATYKGSTDVYAVYFNKAVTELNEGISYYIDYLAFEDELTKGEQDKLINLYSSYIKGFNNTSGAYNTYVEAYEAAKKHEKDYGYEETNYAFTNVNAKAVSLVREYLSCYEKGSEFFKYLVQIVNTYNQNSNNLYSFTGQNYMIKNGLVDYSLNFVLENMTEKINRRTYVTDLNTNEKIKLFNDFITNESKFTDRDTVNDKEFRIFVNNLNCLNIYEWAGNNANYVATLDEKLAEKSNSALNFFNSNFKG